VNNCISDIDLRAIFLFVFMHNQLLCQTTICTKSKKQISIDTAMNQQHNKIWLFRFAHSFKLRICIL